MCAPKKQTVHKYIIYLILFSINFQVNFHCWGSRIIFSIRSRKKATLYLNIRMTLWWHIDADCWQKRARKPMSFISGTSHIARLPPYSIVVLFSSSASFFRHFFYVIDHNFMRHVHKFTICMEFLYKSWFELIVKIACK